MSYVAMWHMPGCLPEMEPEYFDTFAAAQAFILHELAIVADSYGPDALGDADNIIVQVAQEYVPFAYLCDGYVYSVEYAA